MQPEKKKKNTMEEFIFFLGVFWEAKQLEQS